MKKVLLGSLVLGALAAVTPAFARTNVGLSIQIGNAPPPPRVVYVREPRWDYIPEEQVYVVDDGDLPYDYFRYGGFVYIYNDGFWYRSRSYRGPFVSISFTSLPGDFRYVPTSYRRQPYRPGQWSWSDNRNGYRGSNGWQYQNRRDRNNGDYQYVHRDQNRDWNRNDANWRNGYRRWRNDRDQNWRDDDQNGRDGRSHGDGNGRGRGHGRGHGNGNGRGHDDNDD